MFNLEDKIMNWTDKLREKGKFLHEDILELENHLRDEIDALLKKDLTEEEAFIIAIKRIGNSELLSNEFEKINKDIIWKELILYENDTNKNNKIFKDIILLISLCLISGIFAKIPELFGFTPLFNSETPQNYFYGKMFSLFFMPSIAIFFIIKNYILLNKKMILTVTLTFITTLFIILLTPLKKPYHTSTLISLHLPLFLWGIIGLVYLGKKWQNVKQRMNFIRFSGEFFIYAVLLFCGVLVLTLFTIAIFEQIELDIKNFYYNNIWIFTILAVPIIAVYLVEAKKSIVENIAPILAKIFNPLFLITMIFFLISIIFLKVNPSADRNFLITFNFMLILVTGLVTYIISARKNINQINNYDYINLTLIIVAILIDLIALLAIILRISRYGFSANKTAALGENIILFSNLTGLAFFYIRFFIKKNNFQLLEKWQTFYIYIVFIWCGIVSFIFPIIFQFQ